MRMIDDYKRPLKVSASSVAASLCLGRGPGMCLASSWVRVIIDPTLSVWLTPDEHKQNDGPHGPELSM